MMQPEMLTPGVVPRNEARPSFEGLWEVPEAAERLRVSSTFLRNKIAEGALPAVRLGSRVLLDPSDVAEWIEAHKTRAS
jgi:excisionase family DNA binding protein